MAETTGTQSWIEQAERVAHGIRKRALALTIEKNGCYLSQALSSAEVLALLYTHFLRIGPSEGPRVPPPFPGVPRPGFHPIGAAYNGRPAPDRDRLLLSAAHYAVAVYAALVETDRMAPEGLSQFNSDGSSVEMIGGEHSPGMELTTGSFGQALSQAGGIALARRVKGESGRTVVFMSDGEFEEGQSYEAVQALVHYGLDSVVVFVDVNGQQVDGATKDVMNIDTLEGRLRGFGAAVETVDGHDLTALEAAATRPHSGVPLFVLALTDSTRGVPLLERRKPHVHFVRFKSDEEKAEFEQFLERM